MNNKPLISIITASYNNESTIKDTIKSILNQTYTNFEYVIVDGNSKDKTLDLIEAYKDKFNDRKIRYKYLSEPDDGIYCAWNKALKMIHGDWIVFIGADDYFKNNMVFEEMIPYLNQSIEQNYKYVYGKIEHVTFNNQLVEIAGKPWPLQKSRFTYTMNIGHSGCFHHKELFKQHGTFNESFKIAGDYEFLLRELKDPNNNAFFVDTSLIVMREGGVSGSLNNRLTIVKENHKARKLNGILTFSRELFLWEIRVRGLIIISSIFGDNFAKRMADYYRKIFLGKKKRWSI